MTAVHGRLELPDLLPLFSRFPMMPLVSISRAQRAPVTWANWHGTVYHGLPTNLYRRGRGESSDLAFLGRIYPQKGVDKAIEIAHRAGLPLKIAAKIDNADLAYYNSKIKRLLNCPGVEFIGEKAKETFLGGAMLLLFPINWPEPFGLVMIGAMANGIPVIAFERGSEMLRRGTVNARVLTRTAGQPSRDAA